MSAAAMAREERRTAALPVVRWTIGDVSPPGFEALRLSIFGALHVFGPQARYVVCVNSLAPEEAQRRTGPVPDVVAWERVEGELPPELRGFLNAGMSEGTAWKFVPLRVDPDAFELALDNDVILWEMPVAVRRWLDEPHAEHRVIAADVAPAFGRFETLCGPEPRNSGIRGFPPGFEYGAAIEAVLAEHPAPLTSELDEQGLQIAAIERAGAPLVVTTEEVSICSPFHPHSRERGRCGAHYVGLNARDIPWRYYGRPAIDIRRQHWREHREALYGLVGLETVERRLAA